MEVECNPRQILESNAFRIICYTQPSPYYNKSLYYVVSPFNEWIGAEGFEDESLALSLLLTRFTAYYKEKGRNMKQRKEYA
jgi:hypothetical protein